MYLTGQSYREAKSVFFDWFIAAELGDVAQAQRVLNAWHIAESLLMDEERELDAEGCENESREEHEVIVRVPWIRIRPGGVWHRPYTDDSKKTFCGRQMQRAVEVHRPGKLQYDENLLDGAPEGTFCQVCDKVMCLIFC